MQNLQPETFFDLSHFAHKKLFEGCKYPWEIFKKMEQFWVGIHGNAEDVDLPLGVHLVHPESIYIDDDCIIEPGAYIQGPCYLGKGTEVRNGAYIRGNVITGERCVLGHTTEIKNSVLLNDAHASHFAYIGDSIIGNKVNIGAGAKLANLRFDGGDIIIVWDKQKISTGRRKLGAVIGDGTQIGCNAVTNPGTIIGRNSKWYPCINQGGVFPADSIIRFRTEHNTILT